MTKKEKNKLPYLTKVATGKKTAEKRYTQEAVSKAWRIGKRNRGIKIKLDGTVTELDSTNVLED